MIDRSDKRPPLLGWFAALWGLGGASALLGAAIVRVGKIALEALSFELGATHWIATAAWVGFMAWSEGYRGFYLAYSPRVAARARYLRAHPKGLHVLFAPIFCLGFMHATRARKIRSTVLVLGILAIVLVVRFGVPQPWRGIVDAGVVVGLTLGLLSLWFFGYQALSQDVYDYPNDTPD